MTQGCIGIQNDAIFGGVRILRVGDFFHFMV